jgi:membrane protein YdbS with pleckstrin-like domain
MEFNVNKGIGKPAEFKGLQSQYLFIFAGGLLAVFVMYIIIYMVGVNQWICIVFCGGAAVVLVWLVFMLNQKYGAHGLMKLQARMFHPRYLINRVRISKLFTLKTART